MGALNMQKSDARLDTRTFKEFGDNINKWEPIENDLMEKFVKMYTKEFGGGYDYYRSLGFRGKGIERDIRKTNALPDFAVSFTAGPLAGRETRVEIQGMEPDRPSFHIKMHKVLNAIKNNGVIVHVSAVGSDRERLTWLTSEHLKIFVDATWTVPYPGTVCKEFPEGKPAIHVNDSQCIFRKTKKENDHEK
jgi:hypothetical protein